VHTPHSYELLGCNDGDCYGEVVIPTSSNILDFIGEMLDLRFGVVFLGDTSLLTGGEGVVPAVIEGIAIVDRRCTGGLFCTDLFHILVRLSSLSIWGHLLYKMRINLTWG
jgi:hypothetical protein